MRKIFPLVFFVWFLLFPLFFGIEKVAAAEVCFVCNNEGDPNGVGRWKKMSQTGECPTDKEVTQCDVGDENDFGGCKGDESIEGSVCEPSEEEQAGVKDSTDFFCNKDAVENLTLYGEDAPDSTNKEECFDFHQKNFVAADGTNPTETLERGTQTFFDNIKNALGDLLGILTSKLLAPLVGFGLMAPGAESCPTDSEDAVNCGTRIFQENQTPYGQ